MVGNFASIFVFLFLGIRWRLTTLEVKGLKTDLDSTRSIVAHKHRLGVGLVAKLVTSAVSAKLKK